MLARSPVIYIARAVQEAATPLSVSTGSPDGVFDTALVRDANGLPAIPGSSLAGVLRSLWTSLPDAEALFGYQKAGEGRPSRIAVSWGALLDSRGHPAEGLLIGPDATRLDDPLYRQVLAQFDAPVYRDRVRLTHRGAAADQGKFDRAVLPAGNRFAVELRLAAPKDDDGTDWTRLLGLLAHPGLRLGGATRAGLGRMRWVSVHQGRFDLTVQEQAEAYRRLGRGLADTAGLNSFTPATDAIGWLEGTLTLKARGLWRIGQGDEALAPQPRNGVPKPADLLPVTEECVAWKGQEGKREMRSLLIPGSSVKGALAHRMAFHACRHTGVWSETGADGAEEIGKPDAVVALLGDIKDKARAEEGCDEPAGRAGCLFIDDAYVPIDAVQVQHLMHNAIDRFTGGVRDRVLYEEESLFGGNLEIKLALDLNRLKHSGSVKSARLAVRDALDDLCAGRLGLGSRTTTGNGFFTGAIDGSLGDWLRGNDQHHDEEAA